MIRVQKATQLFPLCSRIGRVNSLKNQLELLDTFGGAKDGEVAKPLEHGSGL